MVGYLAYLRITECLLGVSEHYGGDFDCFGAKMSILLPQFGALVDH